MPPLTYHAGQLAIQREAKTTHIAERLANWIGPVAEFARQADLIFLAMQNPDGTLGFTALSGMVPLLEVVGGPQEGNRHQPGSEATEGELRLRFQPDLVPQISDPTPCGGLVINYAQARRARINGLLQPVTLGSELVSTETFTLCRKYIAPSRATETTPFYGPRACEQLPLYDPWLTGVVAQSETMFMASISPDGGPDVAHRGGPAGFLQLDPTTRQLAWSEFVGDGVFKSAGNIRATGVVTVLIPDLESGDAVELVGTATYRNMRSGRQERSNPLEQHREDFPMQGVITCEIQRAVRLYQLMAPRRRLAHGDKITSRATVDDQAPQ